MLLQWAHEDPAFWLKGLRQGGIPEAHGLLCPYVHVFFWACGGKIVNCRSSPHMGIVYYASNIFQNDALDILSCL